MTSTSPDLGWALAEAVEDLPDHLGESVVKRVLRASDKSLLAYGDWHGRPLVIKALRTSEEFWRAKFAHEIHIYQAFTEHPPPVRLPGLIHTDGHRCWSSSTSPATQSTPNAGPSTR